MKQIFIPLFLISLSFLFCNCKKEKQSINQMLEGTWKIKSQTDALPGSQIGYMDYSQSLNHKMIFSADSLYCNQIVTPTWIFQPYNGATSYELDGDLIHSGDSVLASGSYVYLTLPKTFRIISITPSLMVLQHVYPASVSAGMFTIDSLIR